MDDEGFTHVAQELKRKNVVSIIGKSCAFIAPGPARKALMMVDHSNRVDRVWES